jgi:hypothetical protein
MHRLKSLSVMKVHSNRTILNTLNPTGNLSFGHFGFKEVERAFIRAFG